MIIKNKICYLLYFIVIKVQLTIFLKTYILVKYIGYIKNIKVTYKRKFRVIFYLIYKNIIFKSKYIKNKSR